MRQRLLKSLRIAVSAVSLLVCALLIVLWVRSYNISEMAVFPLSNHHEAHVFSSSGVIGIKYWRNVITSEKFAIIDISDVLGEMDSWILGTAQINNATISGIYAPHWFYVTIFAAIAALPWIKWRFSLRTLLIVMTLFAVFFGAIAMSL